MEDCGHDHHHKDCLVCLFKLWIKSLLDGGE